LPDAIVSQPRHEVERRLDVRVTVDNEGFFDRSWHERIPRQLV
jgi:hypothetical protein